MTLENIIRNSQAQFVLSFSNDNDIFVHPEDFEINSKFMRRSKVRLGVEFNPVGFIQDDAMHTSGMPEEGKSLTIVYRTNRGKGKTDYVLYENEDPVVLAAHRRSVKHSKVCESTQLTLNSITEPDLDNIMHIYPARNVIKYSGNLIPQTYEVHVSNRYPGDYYGVQWSIIRGLKILSMDETVNPSEVVIHLENTRKNRDIHALVAGTRKSGNYMNMSFLKALEIYKAMNIKFELQPSA